MANTLKIVSFICEKCERSCSCNQSTFDAENNPKICRRCYKNDVRFKYKVRNLALREIGFRTYAEYLASDMWKTIRTMVLVRDGGKCILCGKRATNVHHQSYIPAVLVGAEIRLLHSLCRDCHKFLEFDEHGNKRTILKANNMMKRCLRRKCTPAELMGRRKTETDAKRAYGNPRGAS